MAKIRELAESTMQKPKDFRITLQQDGSAFETLADILPEQGSLKMLMVQMPPSERSVAAGHYFRTKTGITFWNLLAEYNILDIPFGVYEDEMLLDHGYGMIHIHKVPSEIFGELNGNHYRMALLELLGLIHKHKPKVLLFIYKKILDKILRLSFGLDLKAKYGFNPELERYFGARVFVFPLPQGHCEPADVADYMQALSNCLKS